MYRALGLKPACAARHRRRLGRVEQYCGERGVAVTALTIAEDSYKYLTRLIGEKKLPCAVLNRTSSPTTGGALRRDRDLRRIEHIPNYRLLRRARLRLPESRRLDVSRRLRGEREVFDQPVHAASNLARLAQLHGAARRDPGVRQPRFEITE
jgi:hypothetical protein